MPQLIVGLDSTDESANYIHILDVKENIDYYCPCCKGSIKPRAYKKDEKYKVQPHFYHESGGCSEESYVHYICKTWLFERGCPFKVDGISYTVASIETEKILNTKFGKYKPDIIVHTDQDKTFYFEIKYTNKKCDLFAPKWDELGIDVVEVDARVFVNNKHEEKIPEFKLIYSDGECFIKSYSRTDYEETIAKRKLEWKRQDKLNYKIQWERLDWFWSELYMYLHNYRDYTLDDVMLSYKNVGYDNIETCWQIVSKMSCLKEFKYEFRDVTNSITTRHFNNLITKVFCSKKTNIDFNYEINERKFFRFIWKIPDSYFPELKYEYSLFFECRKWTILPSIIVDVITILKEQLNESINASKNKSDTDKIKNQIINSKKNTQRLVFGRNNIKNIIDIRTKEHIQQKLSKLITRYISNKSGIKFISFIKNDYLYLQTNFITSKWCKLVNQEYNLLYIKKKCNEALLFLKHIDINYVIKREFVTDNYYSITELVKNIPTIDNSTIFINRVLVANEIISEDKDSIMKPYEWLIDEKLCKYFSYSSWEYKDCIKWNGFGGIWLEQNWKYFLINYEQRKKACEELVNKLNKYIHTHSTFKITGRNDKNDFSLYLSLTNDKFQSSEIVYINKISFNFNIGNEYTGKIEDFDSEKSESAMKQLLKNYTKKCEANGIRFIRISEVPNDK